MARLEVITGGARSGKSTFAERRALALAAQRGDDAPVTYIATAVVTDDEMEERIARHRARRPAAWRSAEASAELAPAIAAACAAPGVVLVDCLAVWAANRLVALGDPEAPDGLEAAAWRRAVEQLEADLLREMDGALAAARRGSADLLLVSNEVGLGLVPPTPLGRAYRDLLGRLNQHVARIADAVHLVVAGFALDLVGLGATTTSGEPNDT